MGHFGKTQSRETFLHFKWGKKKVLQGIKARNQAKKSQSFLLILDGLVIEGVLFFRRWSAAGSSSPYPSG